jgi:hypothetical protein
VYLLVVLTSAVAGTVPAHAVDESAAGTDAPPPVRRAHPRPTRDPAAALAKRLDLNVKQTAEVRRLLVIRQARMRAVWTDAAIAADDRVGAVKAINEKTEAQIRALLTEEQRKKYFQPRPSGSLATDPQPSVEEWLNVNRPRQLDSNPASAPDPTPR